MKWGTSNYNYTFEVKAANAGLLMRNPFEVHVTVLQQETRRGNSFRFKEAHFWQGRIRLARSQLQLCSIKRRLIPKRHLLALGGNYVGIIWPYCIIPIWYWDFEIYFWRSRQKEIISSRDNFHLSWHEKQFQRQSCERNLKVKVKYS